MRDLITFDSKRFFVIVALILNFCLLARADWTLCTSTNDFVADDYYMFVCYLNSTYYYVKAPSGNVTQGKYSDSGDGNVVTYSATPTSSLSLSDAGWKLIEGESTGQWKLQSYNSSSVYLYTGTAANKLGANNATTASSYWTITKHATTNTFRITYYSSSRCITGYESSPYGFRSFSINGSDGVQYIQVYRWTSSCDDPAAPGNSSLSSSSQRLTEGSSGDYDFYCSTSSTDPTGSTVASGSVSSGTSVDITGLAYGTTYYYWARTDCGGGSTSGWVAGSPATFTTAASNPTSISAGSTTPFGTTFTITDSNSPASWDIYYSTSDNAPDGETTPSLNTTSKTGNAVTGLTPGTKYYYWVRGVGANDKSSWVGGSSFTAEAVTGISVKTESSTTTYFAGQTFDPTTLVITASYSTSSTIDLAYAGNTSYFTFSPSTVTALTTSNDAVSITVGGKSTNQAINVYSVTVNKVNEDGNAIDAAGVTATWTVGTKTLSAGVSTTNYVFKNWEFATGDDEKGLTIGDDDNTSTTVSGTPTGDVTIKAVFYKPITVSWTLANEEYDETTEVAYGTQWKNLTLPTAPDDDALEDCADTFMGWTNMANHWVGTSHDDAPTVCLKSFSGVTTEITEDIEFKAVFATASGSGAVTYTKVTSISAGTYLMATETADNFISQTTLAYTGDDGTGNVGGVVGVSISTNVISTKPATAKEITVTLGTGDDDGYFAMYDGSKYITQTAKNKFTFSDDISYEWDLNASGQIHQKGTYNSSSDNRIYMANGNSGAQTEVFKPMTARAEGDNGNGEYNYHAYLFKKEGGVTYSDYVTMCCANDITISDPTITGEGEITFDQESPVATCLGATTITATVTPATGYTCTALSFSGGSVSVDPTTASTVPFESATEFELSFAQNTDATLTTSATFSQIMVSSLKLQATQTGQDSKVGNDLTMACYPKEGQTGGNDPLNHSLNVRFNEVLPSNALDKTYDWSVRVKATGDADWTDVAFGGSGGNVLANNAIINSYNKSTGNLQIKSTEGTAEIKITAHDGSGVSAKVTITVTNVALSALHVAKSSTTLYVGEKEEIAVTYDPVNTTTKGYTTGSYSYVTITRANDKITLTGKAATSEQTETVTLTSSDAGAKTATIDVTVKPLPKVTFVDQVHNKTDFSNWGTDGVVASTVSDGVVTHTKTTPSHADVSAPVGGNTCETSHLHLVGWIRSDYDKVSDYMGGTGEKPTVSEISEAGLDDEDIPYFLAPNISIDVRTYDGFTFYAVWAKAE